MKAKALFIVTLGVVLHSNWSWLMLSFTQWRYSLTLNTHRVWLGKQSCSSSINRHWVKSMNCHILNTHSYTSPHKRCKHQPFLSFHFICIQHIRRRNTALVKSDMNVEGLSHTLDEWLCRALRESWGRFHFVDRPLSSTSWTFNSQDVICERKMRKHWIHHWYHHTPPYTSYNPRPPHTLF